MPQSAPRRNLCAPQPRKPPASDKWSAGSTTHRGHYGAGATINRSRGSHS
jgi:hypothetical protein